jgi:MoxR-like ATPase
VPADDALLGTEPATDAPAPNGRTPRQAVWEVRQEAAKVIVGQDGVLSGVIVALLAGGHVLLEGVPGVAKTLLARTVASSLDLRFARIQFTPDLMPSDVTGQTIFATGEFRWRPGPVFTNVLLADEINRTPPKTQAALLEAMEERQVSVEGQPRPLPDPFLVVATQNPVEYEGTYPLPEAQLDRFLLKLVVPYPEAGEEEAIVARADTGLDAHRLEASGLRAVMGPAELGAARAEIARLHVDPRIHAYVVALARATRNLPTVSLGVSPRGATMLLRAAKAWTWLRGRDFVTPDEVQAMVKPAFRHRLALRAEAELDGAQVDQVLDGLLSSVPVPH